MLNSNQTLAIVTLLFVLSGTTGSMSQADDWKSWRGPNQNGTAADTARPPVRWDQQTNMKWARKLDGTGSATPIVVGNQVFVLSAEATSRRSEQPVVQNEASKTIAPDVYYRFWVTSIDRRDGQIIWKQLATEQVPHEGHHPTHTYAGGSPVSDGQHLFVSFASRGIYCFSLAGEMLWQVDLGDMQTRYGWGEAVTPALAGDLLIVNWDQEEGSFITALDKQTGRQVWRTERPGEKTSWNAPLITEFAGRQIAIVNGSGMARGYDAQTGQELWACGGQTTNAIPSAVRFQDFVVLMSGYRGANAVAVPLNSSGDVTGTDAIKWQHTQGTPYVPSALLSRTRLLFTAGNSDVMSCLDVQTGQPLVDRKRLSGAVGFYASPIAASGHLYFVGRQGTTVVLKDDDSLDVVAVNSLEGTFDASPVAVDRQLFLRSWDQLYCIEE